MKSERMLPLILLGLAGPALADGPPAGATAQPVPLTREDMKKALENSKHAVPRLPLPPPTEAEKARAAEAAKARAASAKGSEARALRAFGSGLANNGRMRSLYLSEYSTAGANSFNSSPSGSDLPLDYAFQTMLFWIVSRGNNCTYCMGHQESKLASAGLSDDRIAALDGDWSEFTEAERAAFAFTKKLSLQPYAIADADIEALRKFYDDAQITHMILAVSGFNATNRWTGPLRITQEDRHVFLKPTSTKYADILSRVAPIGAGVPGKGFAAPASRRRPPLESGAEVERQLEAARRRTPRLKLADESATRAALEGTSGNPPEQWLRLLAVFPTVASARHKTYQALWEKGTLDLRTKAIIAYVAARNDHAWYALGHARKRLKGLGFSDEQISALDKPEALESPADREVVRLTRTITVDPALVDDDDIARMRKLFDDKKVAEVVYQITQAASFDRLTEAAGLRLED